jgi:membrane protein
MTAVLLTISLAVFIVLSFGLIVAGPQLADALAERFAFGPLFTWAWNILQWPLAFALVVSGIGIIYYFAPDAEQDFAWITPGSLIAAVLWLAGSLAFRFYVVTFGDYEATYGAITGVILLMLWFYLSGLVLMIGAEASAEIEHASPWGKAPAEKAPGEKKKIGSMAGRAFRQRDHGETIVAPMPVPPERALVPILDHRPSMLERAAALAIVILRWRNRVRE